MRQKQLTDLQRAFLDKMNLGKVEKKFINTIEKKHKEKKNRDCMLQRHPTRFDLEIYKVRPR